MQTDRHGNIEETCTNQPFGDNLQCSGSSLEATEQHFTGKERDTESGLDFFGARYYAGGMGRFMNPDWADKPEAVPYATLTNPQTLNLYAYVGNSPIGRADRDGHLYDGKTNGTPDPDSGWYDEAVQRDAKQKKEQEQQAAQQAAQPQQAQQPISLDTLTTVLYHALGNLTPDPNAKPGEAGSAEDLYNARVGTAEVILKKYRNHTAKPGKTVENDTFSSDEEKAFKNGNPAAVEALRLTTVAAKLAYEGSNTMNGALQYRARWNGDVAGALGRTSKSPGMPLAAHFGPFINESGTKTWQVIGK